MTERLLRLCWITDAHLDFLGPRSSRLEFFAEVGRQRPDVILIGGDFACANNLEENLLTLRKMSTAQIYFVLGNHDYYHGAIEQVRGLVRDLSRNTPKLTWLEDIGYAELGDRVALVGHGCWGDAKAGRPLSSPLWLADFELIRDLKGLSREERLEQLSRLGAEGADYLGRFVREAARRFSKVVVLTHAVPFPETCLHEGRVDPDGLPFFCCAQAGEVLRQVARDFPIVEFLVLSGHTHSPADRRILPNLHSRVQGATYYAPRFVLLEI